MEADELTGHVVAVSVLMLVGVPTNAVVIWIHTRSKSHLTHNKFPLIFAAIDLVAILMELPLFPVAGHVAKFRGAEHLNDALSYIFRFISGWILHAYCSTLLFASAEKLYAVTLPFKYKKKRDLFIKVAVGFAGPIDLVLSGIVASPLIMEVKFILLPLYNSLFLLTFLTTILLYVIIVVRIIQSERSTHSKIQPNNLTYVKFAFCGRSVQYFAKTCTRKKSNAGFFLATLY